MNAKFEKLHTIFRNHVQNPLYKNSYYLILNTIIGSALGFLFWTIAARNYTANDVGLATAIFSAIGLLATISKVGLDISIVKYMPMYENKNDVVNLALSVPLIISVVLSILYIFGVDYWSPNLSILLNWEYGLLFLIFTCAYTLCALQNNIYIAERTAKMTFLLNTFLAVFKIPLLIMLSSLGLFGIFNSWGLATTLSTIIGFIILSKVLNNYKPLILIKKELVKSMMNYSFGNYIASFLFSAPALIIPIFLSNINPEMSAYFYISWMIAGLFYSITGLINMSLFAECSHDSDKLKPGIISVLKFTVLILVPATIGIILFGDLVLSFFGEDYSENAYELIVLLIIASFPYAINQVFITISRVKMKVMPILYLNAFIAFCVFIILYALINEIGLISVGISWLIAQTIGAGMASLYIHRVYLS